MEIGKEIKCKIIFLYDPPIRPGACRKPHHHAGDDRGTKTKSKESTDRTFHPWQQGGGRKDHPEDAIGWKRANVGPCPSQNPKTGKLGNRGRRKSKFFNCNFQGTRGGRGRGRAMRTRKCQETKGAAEFDAVILSLIFKKKIIIL